VCEDLILTKKLATYWRQNLLKKDDAKLGIGHPDEEPVADGEPSESRKALFRLLEIYTHGFKSAGIKLNWKYMPPRRRKKGQAEKENAVGNVQTSKKQKSA
jgi:hypothetical protein